MPDDEKQKIGAHVREIMRETFKEENFKSLRDNDKFLNFILEKNGKLKTYLGFSGPSLLIPEDEKTVYNYYTKEFPPVRINDKNYLLSSDWKDKPKVWDALSKWRQLANADHINELLEEIEEIGLQEKKGRTQNSSGTSGLSDENKNSLQRQIIYFGAPGTGKSHKLKEDSEKAEFFGIERVTFYPGYSYQQFVGTYKPHMNGEALDKNGGKTIEYKFVPGPLMRTLVKALKAANPENEKYLLIIEELNRAEAAAVFGDLFQLLDRDEEGKSDYPVAVSEDLKEYLKNEELPVDSLIFPSNFYIWTTMNSADQGVFPLDTAFKRRWEFEYIGIDDNAVDKEIKNTEWNKFRVKINEKMLEAGINEDKLMGPFFLKKSEQKNFKDSFCGKVLLYLFEDAMRLKRKSFFTKESYSKLREDFMAGKSVFRDLPDLKLSDSDGSESEATSTDQTGPEKNEQSVVAEENTNSDSQQS